MSRAPRHQLPQYEATCVDIDAKKSVTSEVDGALQHLRRHIPSSAHLSMHIATWFLRFKDQRQSEISNTRSHVALEQNVLALKVSMGDSWFDSLRLGGGQFIVQMAETTCHRLGNATQFGKRDGVTLEVIA